jgi:hypothetical protein
MKQARSSNGKFCIEIKVCRWIALSKRDVKTNAAAPPEFSIEQGTARSTFFYATWHALPN